MPRVGLNPMRDLRTTFVPNEVSVCTLVYIPELTGYWAQSLDVLKVCLASLIESTKVPFDLIVHDNGSCDEVREFLIDLNRQNIIQVLLLARENMGKTGAWNVLFPACPGKYIAFTDSDVLFHPGWLEASLRLFEAFERVGMVTGRPFRTPPIMRDEILGATLAYAARGDARVERGELIPHAVIHEHLVSVGKPDDPSMTAAASEDVRLHRRGASAYAYAGHYQFVVPREVAMKVLPLGTDRALGPEEKDWDRRINALGLLRLAVTEPLVRHLGNTLSSEELQQLTVAHSLADDVVQHHAQRESVDPGFVVRNLRQLARFGRVRKVMQRGYATLFKALER